LFSSAQRRRRAWLLRQYEDIYLREIFELLTVFVREHAVSGDAAARKLFEKENADIVRVVVGDGDGGGGGVGDGDGGDVDGAAGGSAARSAKAGTSVTIQDSNIIVEPWEEEEKAGDWAAIAKYLQFLALGRLDLVAGDVLDGDYVGAQLADPLPFASAADEWIHEEFPPADAQPLVRSTSNSPLRRRKKCFYF
jgi:hypothetical protein